MRKVVVPLSEGGGPDDPASCHMPRREVIGMGKRSRGRETKAPIGWAAWVSAVSSAIGAIVTLIRYLTRS